MQRVAHHGRTTAYRKRGTTGPSPVLFVHGSGATHEAWASQFAIASERPVTALDLSGHGASDPLPAACAPGPETLTAYVEDVVAVSRAVDADAVVGASLGGAVVLRAVADGRLAPAVTVVTGTATQMTLDASLERALATDLETTVAELGRPGRLYADPTDDLLAATHGVFAAVGLDVLRRDFRTAATIDLQTDRITTPTTVIAGARDRLVPLAAQQRLATALPQAGLVVVPETAHLPMIERPQEFRQVLRRALF